MDFEIGREYRFIRAGHGRSERAVFTRFEDGGAVVASEGAATIWEHAEDAWALALSDLRRRGFVIEQEPSAPGGPAA